MILSGRQPRFDLPREVVFLDCAYSAPLMATIVVGVSLQPDSFAAGSVAAPGGFVADEVSSRNDR